MLSCYLSARTSHQKGCNPIDNNCWKLSSFPSPLLHPFKTELREVSPALPNLSWLKPVPTSPCKHLIWTGRGQQALHNFRGVEVNRKIVYKILWDRLPKCTYSYRRGLKKSNFRLHLQRLTSLEARKVPGCCREFHTYPSCIQTPAVSWKVSVAVSKNASKSHGSAGMALHCHRVCGNPPSPAAETPQEENDPRECTVQDARLLRGDQGAQAAGSQPEQNAAGAEQEAGGGLGECGDAGDGAGRQHQADGVQAHRRREQILWDEQPDRHHATAGSSDGHTNISW